MHAPPLGAIRIIDFSQVIAGPYGMQLMAYFGAEVIKIETNLRPDSFRSTGYGVHPVGINQSRAFAEFNRNKHSVSVNMSTSDGREVVKRLIALSDAVVENFSYGVLERWELDYPNLQLIKPDIILMGAQGMGQTGSHRDWVTYGPSLLSFSGLTSMWNHPDQPAPVGSQVALPDYVVSVQGAIALLAALDHRRRTGEGQFIGLAQVAGAASLLPTTFLDYFINHRVAPPQGNTHPDYAPYSVYACAGADRWCAIAVTSEEEWASFKQALGEPAWTQDTRFADMPSRVQHRAALDEHVSAWTREREPHAVMRTLQAAGVPAAAVQNAADMFHDEHLRGRGMLSEVQHPEMSTLTYPHNPVHLSETPGELRRHAPLLGQDNAYVFGELLGMEAAEIAHLTERGVLA